MTQATAGRSFRRRLEGPFWRKVMVAGIKAQPQWLRRMGMPFWGGLAYLFTPSARRIIERNLEGVLGPAPAHVAHARSYRLFLNYAHAITNLYVLHLGEELPVEPRFSGQEHVQAILRARRGAIACTGHLGFWQITPFLCARRSWLPPMTMAMAEEPNQALRAYEDGLRQKLRIVYTTASPFASIELANILRRGELVGMQLDRHLGGSFALVPFCGKPAPFPLGPATLARATGAPLLPVFVIASPDRRRCTVTVDAPIEVARTRDRDADVLEGTRRLVAVYERYVRAHPEQWFNFHDFWQAPAAAPRGGALRRERRAAQHHGD